MTAIYDPGTAFLSCIFHPCTGVPSKDFHCGDDRVNPDRHVGSEIIFDVFYKWWDRISWKRWLNLLKLGDRICPTERKSQTLFNLWNLGTVTHRMILWTFVTTNRINQTLSACLNSHEAAFCSLQIVWISIAKTNFSDFDKAGHRYEAWPFFSKISYVVIFLVPDHSKQRQIYFMEQRNTCTG